MECDANSKIESIPLLEKWNTDNSTPMASGVEQRYCSILSYNHNHYLWLLSHKIFSIARYVSPTVSPKSHPPFPSQLNWIVWLFLSFLWCILLLLTTVITCRYNNFGRTLSHTSHSLLRTFRTSYLCRKHLRKHPVNVERYYYVLYHPTYVFNPRSSESLT